MQQYQAALAAGDPSFLAEVYFSRFKAVFASIDFSQPFIHWLMIGGGIFFGLTFISWRVRKRWLYWKAQGEVILTPGRVGPRPTFTSRLIRYLLGRMAVRFNMGPCTVVGRRNLWYPGRVITFGPHFSYLNDTPLALRLMKVRPMRYFIAWEEAVGDPERAKRVTGFVGKLWRLAEALRTPMLAWSGGIPVKRGDSQATKDALNAGIQAMDEDGDSSFIIFPEGKVRPQAQLKRENFFGGAVKLGQKANQKLPPKPWDTAFKLMMVSTVLFSGIGWLIAKAVLAFADLGSLSSFDGFIWGAGFGFLLSLGAFVMSARERKPIAIIPYGVYYDMDPAHATRTHRFIANTLGFKNFRRHKGGIVYRVNVVFGTPVPINTLPEDATRATDLLVRRLERLRRHAESKSRIPVDEPSIENDLKEVPAFKIPEGEHKSPGVAGPEDKE
jgi:1-acyl-sn-glycerol-3-phosphate acyltransferase